MVNLVGEKWVNPCCRRALWGWLWQAGLRSVRVLASDSDPS